MLKIRLLQAVCTVAMLGAVPAFAQSNMPQSNMHGSAAAPAGQQAMPDNNKDSANGNTASSDKDGLGVPSHGPKSHRMAMSHRDRAMHSSSKTDTSQDSTIDQLNNQSYQAAQQGQTFAGNGSGNMSGGASTGMSKSGGSGSMANMSGSGSSPNGMSGSGSAGGGAAGGGAGGAGGGAK
ncbi:MAG TPA: hypothetical protein VGF36_00065 [Rhodopila sp.]